MSNKSNVYNIELFKRLLTYVRSYNKIFIISIISVIGLSVFGALRPVVLEKIVDENLTQYNYDFFPQYILILFDNINSIPVYIPKKIPRMNPNKISQKVI